MTRPGHWTVAPRRAGAAGLLFAALALPALTLAGCSESTATAAAPAESPPLLQVQRTDLDVQRELTAAFLVVDGVYNSELMAPYDILQHTIFHTPEHNQAPGIETFVVSPDGGDVQTFEGLRVGAHHSFESAPPIDILIVPSAEHSMDTDLENEEMIGWVRRVGEQASFVVSLCDGAFVLAQAGLLDGRAATTFPGDQDRFAAAFPAIDLRRGVSFVHDGPLLTSEGGAKSYDVAMYLVDHLYGPETARGVAGGLLIDWPPPAATATIVTATTTPTPETTD